MNRQFNNLFDILDIWLFEKIKIGNSNSSFKSIQNGNFKIHIQFKNDVVYYVYDKNDINKKLLDNMVKWINIVPTNYPDSNIKIAISKKQLKQLLRET